MLSNTESAREARARRSAIRQGYTVVKYRENSRWYQQYGPYALASASTNTLHSWGLHLDELEKWLADG
jgi:hypothetical protein